MSIQTALQRAAATPVLELEQVSIAYQGATGSQRVVHQVSFAIQPGEVVALVGESGSGKTTTAQAIIGLLTENGRLEQGAIRLNGTDISHWSSRRLDAVRGAQISLIPQDPSSSLNPVLRIGRQITEALAIHRGLRGETAKAEALRLMDMVGIPDARRRFDLYSHEFSGGQCQRLMIAMALAGQPDLLVADEPTTALDATIQAQILDLLIALRAETGMATSFISHDLGAVSQVCERACVMYAGRIVEQGKIDALFATPQHPYTRGLFDALPRLDGPRTRLVPIPGTVPNPRHLPEGCAFAPRCAHAGPDCRTERPQLRFNGILGSLACHHPVGTTPAVTQPMLEPA